MLITANQIKTRWTSIIEEWLENNPQIFIKVRWDVKYVILSKSYYDKFREFELEKAIEESKKDIKSWKVSTSINDHLKRINDEI